MLYRLVVVAVLLGLICPVSAQTVADADFSGDRVVDITDFLAFVEAYGTKQGDTNYNAKYDLDGNGTVGINDFLIFVNFYGQTVTDRDILIALYYATGDENWNHDHRWLSHQPLGEWYGVKTNIHGRVVGGYPYQPGQSQQPYTLVFAGQSIIGVYSFRFGQSQKS